MIGAVFNGDEENVKSEHHVYQWDTGQKIMISGLDNSKINCAHFTSKDLKTAYEVSVTNSSGTIIVGIPDIVLRSGKDVYMYLCIKNSNDDVVTVKTVVIPVIRRNMPENYMYNDDENVSNSNEEFKALQTEVTEARKSYNPIKTYPNLGSRLNVIEGKLSGSYGTTDISAGEIGTFSTEFTAVKYIKFRRYYNVVNVWGSFEFSSFTNPEATMLDIFTFQNSSDISDHKYWVAGEFFAPVLVTDSNYSQIYITVGLMLSYINNKYVLRLVLPEGYTLSYLVGKKIYFNELYVAQKVY